MQGEPDAARRAFAQSRKTSQTVENYLNVAVTVIYDLRFALLPYLADRIAERYEVIAVGAQAARQAGAIEFEELQELPNLMLEGKWAAADAYLGRLGNIRHGAVRQYILCHLIRLRWNQGEYAFAADLVRELLPAGRETGPGSIQFDFAVAAQQLAALLCIDAGELASAQAWLETHEHWLAWNGTVFGRADGELIWACYHRQAGDSVQAYACAQSALALIAAHRLLGELDTDAGRYDNAVRHLDASLRLADACAAPYERALTLLVLAALHVATGNTVATVTALDEMRAICTPLGAKPALTRADALAARLTTTQPVAPVYPAGLSAREVDVLRLVARGLTNPRVAECLFLSPRTVEHHLHAIFNKTGVSTRAAAARWATEHALG
jgi:DNA-binding CsgD family transcriptional regulator